MGIKKRDWLKAIKVGSEIGKVFIPGGAGKILDAVTKSIDDPNDEGNTDALKELARINDEQTEAIIALHIRLLKLEGK